MPLSETSDKGGGRADSAGKAAPAAGEGARNLSELEIRLRERAPLRSAGALELLSRALHLSLVQSLVGTARGWGSGGASSIALRVMKSD